MGVANANSNEKEAGMAPQALGTLDLLALSRLIRRAHS